MLNATIEVTNPTGLHTRPGNQFVKLAKQFEAEITVCKGDKCFSAKSLLKLMKIGIRKAIKLKFAVKVLMNSKPWSN